MSGNSINTAVVLKGLKICIFEIQTVLPNANFYKLVKVYYSYSLILQTDLKLQFLQTFSSLFSREER